jgi:hypothetical protein
VTPSPESKRREPLSDEEYLALCRQYGIADDGTWPTAKQVKRAYPKDHESDAAMAERSG